MKPMKIVHHLGSPATPKFWPWPPRKFRPCAGPTYEGWTFTINRVFSTYLLFLKKFPPVRLFQLVRLLMLTNYYTSTFIPPSTSIRDFRVHIPIPQEAANLQAIKLEVRKDSVFV